MKVLNRPMFRYGGPIKEGIMSGIQEPRQRYAEPPGFVVKKDPNKMIVDRSLKNAEAFMNVGKSYDQDLNNQAFVLPSEKDNVFITKEKIDIDSLPLKERIELKMKNRGPALDDVGMEIQNSGKGYIGNEPGIDKTTKEFFSGIGERGQSEGYLEAVKEAENLDKDSPAVITGGKSPFAYTVDEVIKNKGKGGDDEPKVLSREEKVNSILEGLGYDRAQKNALYDAMIKAGQRISRTGLGAENLVSDVIAETSQSYDKPEKLREAANLMQVQQDLKLDQIKASKEGTGTMNQNYNYFKARGYSDEDAARKAEGLATTLLEAKAKAIKEGVDKGNKLTEYVAQQLIGISGAYDNNTYKGTINSKEHKSVSDFVESTDFDGAGVYTVKGRIIELDKNGKILKEEIVTSSTSDKKWWNLGSDD